MPGDDDHQRQRSGIHAIQKRAKYLRLPQATRQPADDRDEYERRKKDTDGCDDCSWDPAQQIADERCRCKDRARRYLPHRNGVEQLLIGKPVKLYDQITA